MATEQPNYNILNSTTVEVILQNLSCCISSKSKEINEFLLQGNLSCYKKEIKNLAILENYYTIIKNSLYTKNYKLYLLSFYYYIYFLFYNSMIK